MSDATSDPGGSVPELPASLSDRSGERYQVLGEIARGGVGVVLKGRDVELGRDVAMKVIRPEHALNRDVLQRFVEEAQIEGQLQHPGIVPVYDLGLRADRRAFFTMKLVKGKTLGALLDERESPGQNRRRFLSIFEQVCLTVGYAHSRGVIHRDLKPSNVMVGPFGEVLVVDWGFAKVLAQGGIADERRPQRDRTEIHTLRSDAEGSESQAGSVMGTPAYMPPEQALGQVEQLDTRSDVFALGAILCEILTGKPPYTQESGSPLVLAAQGRVEVALGRMERDGVDEALVDLVKKCLDPIQSRRPKNAGAVGREVSAYLAAVEERAQEAQRVEAEARIRAGEERKRRRLALVLSSIIVLAVVAGGLIFGLREKQRMERGQEIAMAIRGALDEAAAREAEAQASGPGALEVWTKAIEAARRADQFAGSVEAPPDSREGARAALDRVESAAAAARRAIEREAKDRAMVKRLEEIRISEAARTAPERLKLSAAYRRAFEEYGIDVEHPSEEHVARQISRSAIAAELAMALDSWTVRSGGHRRERLLKIARLADPDSWRNRMRDVVAEPDPGAVRALLDAADLESLHGPSACKLATYLDQTGNPESALRLLRRLQRLRPDGFWANYLLGQQLMREIPPKTEEALTYLRAGLALEPERAFVCAALADALKRGGRLQEATAQWERAVRLDPRRWSTYAPLVKSLGLMGRLGSTLEAWKEEAEENPEDAVARYKLGIAYSKAGNWGDAADAFQEAVDLEPENVRLRIALSTVLSDKEHYEGALEELREAQRIDPELQEAWGRYGWILVSEDRHAEAIPYLERAAGMGDPTNAHVKLGTAYRCLGRHEKAMEVLTDVLRRSPTNHGANGQMGRLLQTLGRADEAMEHYRKGIAVDPECHGCHYQLAWTLMSVGDLERSLPVFERCLELDPDGAWDHYLYGMNLLGLGKLKDAREHLLRYHRLAEWPHSWRFPETEWRRICEIWIALVPNLTGEPEVDFEPDTLRERYQFAVLCWELSLYDLAAQRFEKVFQEAPRLTEGLAPYHKPHFRVEQAAFAMGGAALEGWGKDVFPADDAIRARWRRRSLHWMQRAVRLWRRNFLDVRQVGPEHTFDAIERWRVSAYLAPIRDEERLAALPEEERAGCRALWVAVDELEKLVQGES